MKAGSISAIGDDVRVIVDKVLHKLLAPRAIGGVIAKPQPLQDHRGTVIGDVNRRCVTRGGDHVGSRQATEVTLSRIASTCNHTADRSRCKAHLQPLAI